MSKNKPKKRAIKNNKKVEKSEEIKETINNYEIIQRNIDTALKIFGIEKTEEVKTKSRKEVLYKLNTEIDEVIKKNKKNKKNKNLDYKFEIIKIENLIQTCEIYFSDKYAYENNTLIPEEIVLNNNMNRLNRLYSDLIKNNMVKEVNKVKSIENRINNVSYKVEQMAFTVIGFIVSFGITSGAVAAIPKIPTEYIIFVLFAIVWAWMTLIFFISSIYKEVLNKSSKVIYYVFTFIFIVWTCISIGMYYFSKEDMKKAYDNYKNKIEENKITKEIK